MPPVSKWISGDSPNQPVPDAARNALAARLGAVGEHLERAAKAPAKEVEHVHQLRVWSRRATAALDTFRQTLPKRKRRWFARELKRVRKAAGAARDCDVLAERLSRRTDRAKEEDASLTLARIDAQRHKAQRPIKKAWKRLEHRRFARRVKRLLDKLAWRGDGKTPTFGQVARMRLAPAVGAFFDAAGGDLLNVEALHRFRIAGKQLRYAMELFAGAFDASFKDELYPIVEELQEKLGQINDHASAVTLFESWLEEGDTAESAELMQLIRAETRSLRRCRKAFFDWWTHERSVGLERRLSKILAAR